MKMTAVLEQEQEANQKCLHDLAVMQSLADAQESEVRTEPAYQQNPDRRG